MSTFQRRRDGRKRIRFTNRASQSTSKDENSKTKEPSIILILMLVAYHKLRIFSMDSHLRWNTREQLGDGSTFSVGGSDLPVWRGLSHLLYRNPETLRQKQRFYFTDHTNTKWSDRTIGAYKSLTYAEELNREDIIDDLIKELRILSHSPLQRHPNIVHMLGVAWVRDQYVFAGSEPASEQGKDFGEPREWPTVVIEKAEYGTLRQFLGSRHFRRVRSSLRSKILLCLDVLNGIAVRRVI